MPIDLNPEGELFEEDWALWTSGSITVGKVAENEKHHPDISLGYGYCLIMIHTHAISSLSINDFILAAKIDNINLDS